MRPPFPGIDPWLEHPALWLDVHTRLITAIADTLSPVLAPHYYVGVESRIYILQADDAMLAGRADVAAISQRAPSARSTLPLADAGVIEVELPMRDEVQQRFLEVREVVTGDLITTLEILSPYNKANQQGRQEYLLKRQNVLSTLTNLVEIDLLRAGEPMPLMRERVRSDYRILVSRGSHRPRAQLYPFNLRQPIPLFPLPLLPGDQEPMVDLGAILHVLYERARFDLRLDYTLPPVPPLSEEDAAWARELLSM